MSGLPMDGEPAIRPILPTNSKRRRSASWPLQHGWITSLYLQLCPEAFRDTVQFLAAP